MGRDFQSLTSPENLVAQAFLGILEPSWARTILLGLHFIIPHSWIKRLPLGLNTTLDDNQTFLRSLCHDMIDDKRRDLLAEKGSTSNQDILGTIMQSEDFSDEELVDQMLTFLAAGVSLAVGMAILRS